LKFNAAPGNYSALLVSTDTLIALGTITPSAGNVTIPMGVAEGNYKIRVKTAADSLTGSSDIAIKQIPVAPTIATVLNNVCPGTLVDQALLNSTRSEEHTSELQSRENLVCRLLLEKKKKKNKSL